MATLRLDLSNLSVIDNKFYVIDENKTSLKYAGYKLEDIKDTAVTFADGSTLTIDTQNGNKLLFTAASGAGTFEAALAADVVKDADIAALATKANEIAKAAVAKLDTSAGDAAKKQAATEALTAAAEKAGQNTLANSVYTKAIANLGTDGTFTNTDEFATLEKVFGKADCAALPTPATLDFRNAGAITYDASSNTALMELLGSAYADKLTVDAKDNIGVDAGEGNDLVTVKDVAKDKTATINLGDGNDTLKIGGTGDGTAKVTLGDGKDSVEIANDSVSVEISDYNYADGDKINLTYATASTDISGVSYDGSKASVAVGKVTVTVASSDNVGAFDLTDKDKNTTTFFAATDTASTKTKEVEINAKGISNKVNINTTNSKLANITLGSGESNVTLANAGNADVINATGAGKVTVKNFKDKEDTLILDGANLSNIKLAADAQNGAELTYGKTTIGLTDTWNDAGKVINLNDSKLAFDLKGTDVTLATGADMYYGNADKSTTVETTGNVHLTETAKYKNIYKVAVKTTGVEADKLDLSGFTTSGTDGISIDASASTVAVNVWAYNKNTKATDTITLSTSNNKQDTVSFVSDDGKVSVANFGFGSSEESDILYLRDTKDLQKLAVKSGEIKLGNSKATVGHAANGNDLMQVKLADGTTSLVAANFSTVPAEASSINVNLTSTQAVDFYALTGTKNTLNVTKDSSVKDAINFKYSNFDNNHTTGTLVNKALVSGFGNDDDEVTIGAVANVDVKGNTAGKTHIWVCGAAESGNVALDKNGSKDQIDFVSGIDKKVTVTGYDAAGEDTIYLRGAEDLKAVTAGYKFESKNGGIQITGTDNATSKLILDGATDGNLNLKTLNGSKLKAIVSTADATFSTDTQIYAGMKKIVADMSTEGDIAVRVGTKGKIGLDSSNTYYVGNTVNEFDGSNSNAVFHLAGSSTAATTLRGGNTKNSFYGGGSFNDTMVGNSSAVDTFYFGKGDGKDTIMEADGKDTVYLMNATLEEITVDTKNNTISIGNDTLTFGAGAEDALKAGELTFNIGGSNYVCKDGKFVAKEA